MGIGAGQMSRVDSVRIAIDKAQATNTDLTGGALASDAFFPFSDGPQLAVDAGVTAVIQPGGSVRDHEVVEAADAAGISMVFTGRRHFRHEAPASGIPTGSGRPRPRLPAPGIRSRAASMLADAVHRQTRPGRRQATRRNPGHGR